MEVGRRHQPFDIMGSTPVSHTFLISMFGIKIRGCEHKKVTNISYTTMLPSITGDNTRFYEGFCDSCEHSVYARTGKSPIKWNLDRNETFKS